MKKLAEKATGQQDVQQIAKLLGDCEAKIEVRDESATFKKDLKTALTATALLAKNWLAKL